MGTVPKTILITGANRGLGFEMVKQMAQRYIPDAIFATYRDPTRSEELFQLALEKPCIYPVLMDVKNPSTFTAVVEKVKEVTGEKGLNMLINNAGVYRKDSQSLEEISKEMMLEFLEVNTLGAIFVTQAFLPLLEQASKYNSSNPTGFGKAVIVNLSSRLGSIQDNKSGGFYASRCTRAALNSATRSMSIDLKDKGIITISMNPGWVQTDQGGLNAPLKKEESISGILKVLENLCSDDNGAFLQYDGASIPW